MIAIIAAMTADRVIGINGRIPWHIPEDLALFKKITSGHTVVMGRKTFESLGKPLPKRRNIVVSRTLHPGEGYEVFPDLERAVDAAQEGDGDVFLIGGESIYREGLRIADTLYLSMVEGTYEGDTRFPEFDTGHWQQVRTEDYPRFTFTVWKRTSPPGF